MSEHSALGWAIMMNVVSATESQPDRSEGLARPAATTPASLELARRVEVALAPAAVEDALRRRPRMVEFALADEPRYQRSYFDGTVFHEATDDGLVLWRRPDRTWLEVIRGQGESIPYPDTLRIRTEPSARGSVVTMQWERHPITRSSALVNLLLGVLVMAALWAHGGLGPWIGLVALMAAFVPLARFLRIRRARSSLLRTAYEALAPHELGDIDRENSAFRSRPSSRS